MEKRSGFFIEVISNKVKKKKKKRERRCHSQTDNLLYGFLSFLDTLGYNKYILTRREFLSLQTIDKPAREAYIPSTSYGDEKRDISAVEKTKKVVEEGEQ